MVLSIRRGCTLKCVEAKMNYLQYDHRVTYSDMMFRVFLFPFINYNVLLGQWTMSDMVKYKGSEL